MDKKKPFACKTVSNKFDITYKLREIVKFGLQVGIKWNNLIKKEVK